MSLLLTLNIFHTFSSVSLVELEQAYNPDLILNQGSIIVNVPYWGKVLNNSRFLKKRFLFDSNCKYYCGDFKFLNRD